MDICGLITGGAKRPAAKRPRAKRSSAPREWVPSFESLCRPVSTEHFDKSVKRAIADIEKKCPDRLGRVPRGTAPVFLVVYGPPGSGKSTIVGGLSDAAGLRIGRQYAVVDYDTLDRYYPTYDDLTNIPAFSSRKKLGIGFAHAHMCAELNDFTIRLGDAIIDTLTQRRVNLAVVSHRPTFLVHARLVGYRTVFVYIGAQSSVVVRRARKRALETGFLLAPTMDAQDSYVRTLWEEYLRMAPWYAVWADLFVAVSNTPDRDLSKPFPAKAIKVFDVSSMRGDLNLLLTRLYRLVTDATGIPPSRTPLPSIPAVHSYLIRAAKISRTVSPPSQGYGGRYGSRGCRYGGAASAADTALAVAGTADGPSLIWRSSNGEFFLTGVDITDLGAATKKEGPGEPVGLVFPRKESILPPIGSEIALGAAFGLIVYSIHKAHVWVVSPSPAAKYPCMANRMCRRLLTTLPWAERLAAWDEKEGAGGARLLETYPAKALEFGFSAITSPGGDHP